MDADRLQLRLWGFDLGLIAMVLLPLALSQPSTDPSFTAWALLTGYGVVAAGALLVRRRLPATATLVIVATLTVTVVAGAAAGHRSSPLDVLPLGVALYSLGSDCGDTRRTVRAALGVITVVLIGLWVNHSAGTESEYHGGFDVLAVLAPMPLVWAMGYATRTRRALHGAAEQRVADATREQHLRAEQAAQQERLRIAREMHDVVAHSLTLLVIHAEALRARSDELPGWAHAQVDGLAAAGRQTGGELRDLLRMLRDPSDLDSLQPIPGFGELGALLDIHRAAGGTVDVRIRAELDLLPRPLQLVGYRVIQESLTNARRHAPGAAIRLTVEGDRDRLRLEVVNFRAAHPGTRGAGTGLGLVSMRERVDAMGGELTAEPTGDGGFRVVATMPMENAGV
ncbi:sensor histidine kinase [Streptomyces fagopyri]|uniref:sensor histidine kinase n=1 Tax=Streptomyces fagopyri TaxID=2662397 RepID=UPI0038150329